jgi:hypothetical protein
MILRSGRTRYRPENEPAHHSQQAQAVAYLIGLARSFKPGHE